jgi:hypothetical protein
VDRHEQIGALIAGDRGALPQREVVVAFAGQRAAITRGAVEQPFEFLRDRQCDALFLDLADADRAGILSAVTGVDRDDEIAQRTFGRARFAATGLRFRCRRRCCNGHRRRRRRHRFCRRGSARL